MFRLVEINEDSEKLVYDYRRMKRFVEENRFKWYLYTFIFNYLLKHNILPRDKIDINVNDRELTIRLDKRAVSINLLTLRDNVFPEEYHTLLEFAYWSNIQMVVTYIGFILREGDNKAFFEYYASKFLKILSYKLIFLIKRLLELGGEDIPYFKDLLERTVKSAIDYVNRIV